MAAVLWERLFIPLPQLTGKAKLGGWLGIFLLFVLGIVWMGYFTNWGVHEVTFMDWAEITAPRLTLLRNAVTTWQLPLHISDPGTLHAATYRFLAVPDTLLSPQMLLMRWMSVTRFNYFNLLLSYGAGFIGLLLLARRLRLSLVTFSFAFLLYNFNGNLLAHLSIGHVMWSATYLLSWFIWLMLCLLDGERSWRWILMMAGLLTIIWLQGAFHHYLWLLLLLAFTGIFVRGTFWQCLGGGVFALLGSMVRILPAYLYSKSYSASFVTGFPSLAALIESLVSPGNQLDASRYFPFGLEGFGAWEFNTYIGLSAALVLFIFGVGYGLLRVDSPWRRLAVPLGLLALLSLGSFYGWLRYLPIPLIQGERASARIILIPLLFLILFSAERLQRFLERRPEALWGSARALTGFVLALAVNDMWHNLRMWNLPNAAEFSWWIYFDKYKWFVSNRWDDVIYIQLLGIGLAVSLITFLVLGSLSWREWRGKKGRLK